MALIVGTNTYDTLVNVNAYWAARGNADWVDADSELQEQSIIKATDWLERNFRWRGTRMTSEQRLGWPRFEAFDDDDFAIGETSAPWQVKEAMAIAADILRVGTYDLEGIMTSNNRSLKRQKVDIIEVEYDSGTRLPGADVVSHVVRMLASVTAGNYDRLLRV